MDPLVFFVVLLAAALHAGWNALVKNAGDKHVSMTAVVLGHAPLAILALPFVPLPNSESWPFVIASVIFHIGYQLLLLFSYRIGDLTQVYPIARGAAPLIVAGVSVMVLGVQLSATETLAVLAIAIGIISLVFVRGSDGIRNTPAALMALATGCCIAGYSLVDGLGARQAGTALGFWVWITLINVVVFPIIMIKLKPGLIGRVAREGRSLLVFGGGASFLAYALVIWAFTQAPIPLVTALRETSIIFALLIGVLFLNERLNVVKVASTALTLFGAVLLRFSR